MVHHLEAEKIEIAMSHMKAQGSSRPRKKRQRPIAARNSAAGSTRVRGRTEQAPIAQLRRAATKRYTARNAGITPGSFARIVKGRIQGSSPARRRRASAPPAARPSAV